MMLEMEDVGYVWSKNKYERVRQKRGICFHEVVSALENEEFVELPHEQYEERFAIVALTAAERLLVVVISEEELPVYRIITAFDAEGRFRDEYEKRYPT